MGGRQEALRCGVKKESLACGTVLPSHCGGLFKDRNRTKIPNKILALVTVKQTELDIYRSWVIFRVIG